MPVRAAAFSWAPASSSDKTLGNTLRYGGLWGAYGGIPGPMGASPGIHRPNRKSITTNVLQLNESTRAQPSRTFMNRRFPHFPSGNSGREPRAAAFGLVDNGERRAVLGFPIQGVDGE